MEERICYNLQQSFKKNNHGMIADTFENYIDHAWYEYSLKGNK